jgi:hypothetical protein
MKQLIPILLVCVFLTGCISYTCPSDRAVIHDGMLNAVDITDKVLADPNASPSVKRWFVAERTQWLGLDAWANTHKWPTTQAAGVK